MSPSPSLTRKAAAVVCGISLDTLRRYDREGKLPGRSVGDDGAAYYPVADLVTAGLLDPLVAAGSVAEVAGRSRVERDLAAPRLELAVARAHIVELSVGTAARSGDSFG